MGDAEFVTSNCDVSITIYVILDSIGLGLNCTFLAIIISVFILLKFNYLEISSTLAPYAMLKKFILLFTVFNSLLSTIKPIGGFYGIFGFISFWKFSSFTWAMLTSYFCAQCFIYIQVRLYCYARPTPYEQLCKLLGVTIITCSATTTAIVVTLSVLPFIDLIECRIAYWVSLDICVIVLLGEFIFAAIMLYKHTQSFMDEAHRISMRKKILVFNLLYGFCLCTAGCISICAMMYPDVEYIVLGILWWFGPIWNVGYLCACVRPNLDNAMFFLE